MPHLTSRTEAVAHRHSGPATEKTPFLQARREYIDLEVERAMQNEMDDGSCAYRRNHYGSYELTLWGEIAEADAAEEAAERWDRIEAAMRSKIAIFGPENAEQYSNAIEFAYNETPFDREDDCCVQDVMTALERELAQ